MQKAYTRTEVTTGVFLLSKSQGPKTPAWNLFYKRKREAYNTKSNKKEIQFYSYFSCRPKKFFS